MIYELGKDRVRTVDQECFIAPSADVVGRVRLGRDASVWFGAVVRGDTADIHIGHQSNVQDNAVVHVDADAPCHVGDGVTIGHGATVHGCRIGDGTLVGIGATILSHAIIGRHCIIGAHALVTERKEFPDRSLIVGVPAKRVREVTDEEVRALEEAAEHYAALGRRYRQELAAGGEISDPEIP
jgi:carbonic anhydrase/acetyltransferase-like protein (isoleucine patch superfamily)